MTTLPGSLIREKDPRRGHYRYIHTDGNHYQIEAHTKEQAIQAFANMLADTDLARQRYEEWAREQIAQGKSLNPTLIVQEPIPIGLAEEPSGYTYAPRADYHSREE